MSERAGFDRIIGNEIAKQILGRAARTQRPAHSYLFLGVEGVGKFTTALQFAKALNCEAPTDSGACELCASCRRIEHLTTTDMIIYAPEKGKTVISIEQMQQMRDFCQLRPTTMRWKVMILEKADVLGDEAANCILKLLEDAPDYLVVIQVLTNPANVLATIRSRSQVVRFYPSGSIELSERLVDYCGIDAEKALFLSKFSLGCPGKAIAYSSDSSFLVERDEVIDFGRQVLSANKWSLLAAARPLRTSDQGKSDSGSDDEGSDGSEPDADIEDSEKDAKVSADARKDAGRSQRGTAVQRLALAISWFRDLLAIRIGGSDASLINLDRRDQAIEQAAMARSSESLMSALDALVKARSAIVSNANAQIVTESLVMQLASLVRRNVN